MQSTNCKECGYSNESQRVYCHNCGNKLDRAALIEEAKKPKKPPKPANAFRLGRFLGGFFAGFVKATLCALLVAALIQAARKPDGAPKDQELGDNIVDAPSLTVELEEAATTPRRLVYTEPALDAYLDNRIKAAKDSLIPVWLWRYEKSFVNFGDGTVRLTKQYRAFNLPVCIGGNYEPNIVSGAFKPKVVGGNIGRLPIAQSLFDLIDGLVFSDFVKGMDEENKGLSRMKTIHATPAAVEVISG